MDIQPIHTEAEYEAALAEIERLFDAAPHTPEGDRLEVLATLVEAYEEQHYSIPAPTLSKRFNTTWKVAGSAAVIWNPTWEAVREWRKCSTVNAHCPWR